MALMAIRMELARTKEKPEGDPNHGYELVAPLSVDGHLDVGAWRKHHQVCSVRRFAPREADEHGILTHTRGGKWIISYRPGEDDDEPIFRFAQHCFAVGEYVSITEHDGTTRPFKVVSVSPWHPGTPAAAQPSQ